MSEEFQPPLVPSPPAPAEPQPSAPELDVDDDELESAPKRRRSVKVPSPQAIARPALPDWMRKGDHAMEVLVWVMLFGGVLAWGYAERGPIREVLWLGCCVLGAWSAICALAGRWSHPDMGAGRWALALLAFAAAWSGAQLLPLPADLAARFSPVWKEILAAQADAGLPLPARATLAVSPARAADSWAELVACAMFFSCVLMLASRRSSAHRLMNVLAILSVLEGWLGFSSYVSGEGRSLGGVFNPNHHAALVALGLPLWFARVTLWRRNTRFGQTDSESQFRASNPGLLLYAVGVMAALGWLSSFSRGGVMIGGPIMAIWAGYEAVAHARQHRQGVDRPEITGKALATGAVGVALLALTLAGLVITGKFLEGLSARGVDTQLGNNGRWELWHATLVGLGRSPITGLGLGGVKGMLTRYAQLPLTTAPIWTHNDYLQWMADLGLPAFLVCAAIAGRLAWLAGRDALYRARTFRWSRGMMQRAATAGVAAVLGHALVDFHLRVPQIALAFLAALALAIGGGPVLISSRTYGRLLGIPFAQLRRATEEDEG